MQTKMSSDKYSIHPIEATDIPVLGQYVHDSKLGLTINRLLFKDWPNDVIQRATYTSAIDSAFKEPLAEQFKVIDNESKQIVGQVCLTRRKPCEAEATAGEGDGRPPIPDFFNEEIVMAVRKMSSETNTEKDVDHLGRLVF
jgi:hypothetical protein